MNQALKNPEPSPVNAVRAALSLMHERAENHPLMQHLMSDAASARCYRRYLLGLLPVYQHIESALPSMPHPCCKIFQRAWLQRTPALQIDLEHLKPGAHNDNFAPPTTLTEDLAEAFCKPVPLAALAYVRFFGDLAGGQQLARHLDTYIPSTALNFHSFECPKQMHPMQAFKMLRRELDAALMNRNVRQQFIASASLAFGWHMKLFDVIWFAESLDAPRGLISEFN